MTKHFRVVAEQTRQVTFIIDADSEEEAKEYYGGEGSIIREDEGELNIVSVKEVE